MLHSANKKLLYSLLTQGLKDKYSLLHPQPLLDQLLDLELLEEQKLLYAVNPKRVICLKENGQDQFFVYVARPEGYEIEYLNDAFSSSFIVKNKTFRDVLPKLEEFLHKSVLSKNE